MAGWPIYSERFLQFTQSEVWVSFKVARGKRAIVKQVQISSLSYPDARVDVRANGYWIGSFILPAGKGMESFQTYVPVYGDEEISAWTNKQGVFVTVAGFYFDDPSSATGPPHAAREMASWPPPPAD